MRNLLVEHYGFDTQTCVLLDEAATLSAFRGALDALAARADREDEVVIYFSGHGGQLRDRTQDEGDGLDETIALHDARNGSSCDMRDDEFHHALRQIAQTGSHVTVILESCHAGGLDRAGDKPHHLGTRILTPPECTIEGEFDRDRNRDGMAPGTLPNVVLLAAADAHGLAYERAGRSHFTRALVEVLEQAPAEERLTWGTVMRRAQRRLDALYAFQRPQLMGNHASDRGVFVRTTAGPTWQVHAVEGDQVTIRGPMLPGWTPGAIAHVYSPDAPLQHRAIPARATAGIRIDSRERNRATATVISDGAPAIPLGSRVVLGSPGRSEHRLPVRLTGATSERAAVTRALRDTPDLAPHLDLAPTGAAVTVELTERGYALRDLHGITVVDVEESNPALRALRLPSTLRGFVEQQVVLQMEGDGRGLLINDHSLAVRLVPQKVLPQAPCADSGWRQADYGALQEVPVCAGWMVEVDIREDAGVEELSVGGAILWNDGTIEALPSQDVRKGDGVIRSKLMLPQEPLNALEHVVVVGVPKGEDIPWASLTHRTRAIGLKDLTRTGRVIRDVLFGRAPGLTAPPEAWTTTVVRFRTVRTPECERPECAQPH